LRADYDTWHQRIFESEPEHEDADSPWYRLVREKLGSVQGLRVLEVACGRGGFVRELARAGAHVTGCDFSMSALAVGRAKITSLNGSAPAALIQGNAQCLPFASKSFDMIVSCETIEHVPDVRGALREMWRVARPGAKLFLTTPIAGCAETEERVRHYFSSAAQGSINVRPFIPRAEMPELYAQHDIFVLPSLVEGMPLVLLEAMASGLAVVTTGSSGMTELVEDGHDGLLTIPGDADSLTVAMSTLCGNSQLRHKLGCAAQGKMTRFTWKLSALRHEAVFRRAMGVKPLPTAPEPQETDVDGTSCSGKVVLN
jgi:SAM-dependent methyltransferase